MPAACSSRYATRASMPIAAASVSTGVATRNPSRRTGPSRETPQVRTPYWPMTRPQNSQLTRRVSIAARSTSKHRNAAMTVTPTTGVNVAPTTSASATSGVPAFTSNFNTFLTMLTTQLQHQDPLSPLDTSQFTQQLVSFSEVEQQINTNKNLQQLIQIQNTNQASAATPLVGQTIEYSSATAPLASGQAGFSYTLPSAASSVNLSVKDANG